MIKITCAWEIPTLFIFLIRSQSLAIHHSFEVTYCTLHMYYHIPQFHIHSLTRFLFVSLEFPGNRLNILRFPAHCINSPIFGFFGRASVIGNHFSNFLKHLLRRELIILALCMSQFICTTISTSLAN